MAKRSKLREIKEKPKPEFPTYRGRKYILLTGDPIVFLGRTPEETPLQVTQQLGQFNGYLLALYDLGLIDDIHPLRERDRWMTEETSRKVFDKDPYAIKRFSELPERDTGFQHIMRLGTDFSPRKVNEAMKKLERFVKFEWYPKESAKQLEALENEAVRKRVVREELEALEIMSPDEKIIPIVAFRKIAEKAQEAIRGKPPSIV